MKRFFVVILAVLGFLAIGPYYYYHRYYYNNYYRRHDRWHIPDGDRLIEGVKGLGGKILMTSLLHEDKAKLQAVLNRQNQPSHRISEYFEPTGLRPGWEF